MKTRELLPRRGHQVKPARERLGQGGAFLKPSNCASPFKHVESAVQDRVLQATHIFLEVQ